MIFLLIWISSVIAGISGIGSTPSTGYAVVELFTSEGCSSCPPAEKLLTDLKADAEKNSKNVYFLQYHVDYWNRLGWKDPFGSFQWTNRQKNYTSALSEESMYTPMMIVNGKKAFTGSDAEAAKSAIAAALVSGGKRSLEISIDSIAGDSLYVKYGSSQADKNCFIRSAITEDGLVSEVKKGENAGKTLTHQAVVRSMISADCKLTGQLKIPLKKITSNKNSRLVVFIQHKQTMEIFSVASVELSQ